MDLIALFDKGGPLMFPILLASLVALTVFFERLWCLQERRVAPRGLCKALHSLPAQGNFVEAETLLNQSETGVAHIGLTALRHRGRARESLREAMEEAGERVLADLERFTGVLATVATVSPLLGLLGTVTGMITVFQDVAGVADPEIATLAGGIWEALVTTAAGLTVAIPTYIMHRYLMGRLDYAARTLADESLRFLDELSEAAGAGEAPGTQSRGR